MTKITEFINQLQALKVKFGDVSVMIHRGDIVCDCEAVPIFDKQNEFVLIIDIDGVSCEKMKWTKKLDTMHISIGGECLCGKACLGNNYAKDFPDREMCPECELLSVCSECGIELNDAELKENKGTDNPLCFPCIKGNRN